MCRSVIAFTHRHIKFWLRKKNVMRWDTSVSIVTKPQSAWPRNLGLIPGRHRDLSIAPSSRSALGFKQPLIQWILGGSFPVFKVAAVWRWPPAPSTVEVNNERSYISTPTYIFTARCTGTTFIYLPLYSKILFHFLSQSATWYIVIEVDVTQVSYKWNQLRTCNITNWCGISSRIAHMHGSLCSTCSPLWRLMYRCFSFFGGCSLKGVKFYCLHNQYISVTVVHWWLEIITSNIMAEHKYSYAKA
jgi:hypothetical protein